MRFAVALFVFICIILLLCVVLFLLFDGVLLRGRSYTRSVDDFTGISSMSYQRQVKIQADDRSVNDRFGHSVAADGDHAIVGAFLHDAAGVYDSGAAYIFKRDGGQWMQEQKVFADDGRSGDMFGLSVDLHGSRAIVSAHRADTRGNDAGAAYIFKRDGNRWVQEAKLQANDGRAGDEFGNSVALWGRHALVGVNRADTNGADAGAAYIFRREGNQWVQEAKLQANDGRAGDWFGYSVALSERYAVVGAHEADIVGVPNAGAAYIFKRDSGRWVQEVKVHSDSVDRNEYFGKSVAVSGDAVAVGAYKENTVAGIGAGSVHVFIHKDGVWLLSSNIEADAGQAGDEFGYSVDFGDRHLVVSAPKKDVKGGDAGVVYILRRDTGRWVQEVQLQASDGQAGDEFGKSVDVGDGYIIVGSWLHNFIGDQFGAAYIFSE